MNIITYFFKGRRGAEGAVRGARAVVRRGRAAVRGARGAELRARAVVVARVGVLGLGLMLTPRAWAWGCTGHQVVALIALAHLTPAARAEVDRILAADGRQPNLRSCVAEGLPALAAFSNWADQVRNGTTAPYHYVDLPLGAKREDFAEACADDCVTFAIGRYTTQLETSVAPEKRFKALLYLVHLVGDVHQPLHDVDEAGQAGREVTLAGMSRHMTLHAAWDSGVITVAYPILDVATLAGSIDRRYGKRRALGSEDPVAWAWESHVLACRFTRGVAPGEDALPDSYVDAAEQTIESQLDLAGLRLARLLNQALAR